MTKHKVGLLIVLLKLLGFGTHFASYLLPASESEQAAVAALARRTVSNYALCVLSSQRVVF